MYFHTSFGLHFSRPLHVRALFQSTAFGPTVQIVVEAQLMGGSAKKRRHDKKCETGGAKVVSQTEARGRRKEREMAQEERSYKGERQRRNRWGSKDETDE
jgi:hypothetical protein